MKAFQPGEDSTIGVASYHDKTNEVKEFLERKTNIKELVDSGIVKVPRMFIHPPETIQSTPSLIQDDVHLHVPLIDFKGYQGDCRAEIVEEMRKASETWGMFQIINHGVPKIVMGMMLESIRQFHEQPKEVKMEFYSNINHKQKVLYYSSGSFSGPTLPHWRDTLFCILDDGVLDPKALPSICSLLL
ncbi:Non-hem dioxygenase N-terminal domain [Dillenia turbinata]|uniref:Non-hem dioxygenase N-terminal domain n=1 Tax=Dillenia turbinata TaxID=194707 RepID=A0AAN8W3G8_9MAGN